MKTTLKGSVAAAALFAVAAPVQADTIDSSNSAKVTMSGQFNKALMYMESGSASRATMGDNDVSQGRFRINADLPYNEALTIRGHMEVGFASNNLGSASPVDTTSNLTSTSATDTDGGSDTVSSVRKTYLMFIHKQFGTLAIGQDGEASDGAFLQGYDPGGGGVDTGAVIGGGIDLQTSNAADNVFSTNKLGAFFAGFDGGNTNGIHYDTPSFGGATLKYSFLENQASVIGAFWGGDFGGFSVKAGGAYEMLAGSSAASDGQYTISGGIKHESGLSISAGFGEQDATASGAAEDQTFYAILGYEADLISAGSTGFSLQYIQSDDVTADGDEATAYTFGINQGLGSGVNAYAGLQLTDIEQAAGVSYEDTTVFITGARLQF